MHFSNRRKFVFATAVAGLGIALTACSSSDSQSQTQVTATETVTVASEVAQAPTSTSSAATPATGTGTQGEVASGLRAIEAALAAHPGATAYELDWDDNQWDVHLRTAENTGLEVKVSADGAVVASEAEDLDSDAANKLSQATITLAQAIETSGVQSIDDVELEEENGLVIWKVDPDNNQNEVRVNVATGEVV
ncbi:hypothetical protein NQ015_09995 [Corynebacterium sp. 153RC1]|uniref:PepSY domain-containing protein n=1 Tax=unclassified Corynebacterium TaxID=2624378 RepID=UPI00211BE8F7|nr:MULTISPECIES: hypothetical protein [unclassified Corynebacterium]MCQ9353306.1 hypothetical protein [Corynebacterium sp. 209RC1]MCQ9355554.1 hypothetical protein [Corynebacterium sp. 1222RC1]MCQ9357739.1 hypothetical protein [Corynebacterium sp. 122RC1]MCQ9359926.1 hypothetical protein [Corynebacterium sp. 142RC1]MCQ9362082.1 hypothetical protein [Corynebacterium sp. 153RC1]